MRRQIWRIGETFGWCIGEVWFEQRQIVNCRKGPGEVDAAQRRIYSDILADARQAGVHEVQHLDADIQSRKRIIPKRLERRREGDGPEFRVTKSACADVLEAGAR